MTGQILLRELVKKSAHDAFRKGQSIDDCPTEFAIYANEWRDEFLEISKRNAFELSCDGAPCSQ